MRSAFVASLASLSILFAGCDQKPGSGGAAKPSVSAAPSAAPKDDVHKPGESHDHKPGSKAESAPAAAAPSSAGHGPSIELGTTTVDGMTIKAARDAGELKPGGDAAIDVWINGGVGDVAAVRFWIGLEDSKVSVKAKAAVENGKWHTHTEIPAPLPEGSRLWIEVEGKDGRKSATPFELR